MPNTCFRPVTTLQEAIVRELLLQPPRDSSAVARSLACTPQIVSRVRRRMEAAGAIPRWRHEDGLEGAIRERLQANYTESDRSIAREIGSSRHRVATTRRRMERDGLLVRWTALMNPKTDAGKRVRNELTRDCARTNAAIATVCGSSKGHVHQVRLTMEARGQIRPWRGGCSGAISEGARVALESDHSRPNTAIALECNCSEPLVATVRKRMEDRGEISRWRGTERGRSGYTYFARADHSGLIKIGKTVSLKRRLALLNSQSPEPITMIGVVPGTALERELHSELYGDLHHNEWFNPTAKVQEAIADALKRAKEGE